MSKAKTQFTIDDFEGLSERQLARIADVYDLSTAFVDEWKRDEDGFEVKVMEYLDEQVTVPLDLDEVAIIRAIIGYSPAMAAENRAVWSAEIYELQQAVAEMNAALCNHAKIKKPWKDLKKSFKALKQCISNDEYTNPNL